MRALERERETNKTNKSRDKVASAFFAFSLLNSRGLAILLPCCLYGMHRRATPFLSAIPDESAHLVLRLLKIPPFPSLFHNMLYQP